MKANNMISYFIKKSKLIKYLYFNNFFLILISDVFKWYFQVIRQLFLTSIVIKKYEFRCVMYPVGCIKNILK